MPRQGKTLNHQTPDEEGDMRAIAVSSFKVNLEFIELPKPQPKADEILVRLSVAGINPIDWKIADGAMDGQVGNTFPLVLGFDGAGTVEAAGAAVMKYKIGDQVFGQFWQFPLGARPIRTVRS
jgi:NADPH2:quinone reductase